MTLVRTNARENEQMGEWIARKLHAALGIVCFVIPMLGFSALDKVSLFEFGALTMRKAKPSMTH